MSVALNGTNQYLRIATVIGAMTHHSAKTWCGWFKPSSAVQAGWLVTNPSSDESNCVHGLESETSNDFRGWGTGGRGSNFGSFTPGTWYFIAMYKGNTSSNSTDLFYAVAPSGFDDTGDFAVDNSAAGGTADDFNRFVIGRRDSGGTFFAGEVACVRIFNTKLTLAELLLEAKSATPVKTGNIVANWRLANVSAGYLDSTVGSYTLTPFNSPTAGATEPADISGVVTPTITNAGDELFDDGETGITITGTGFGASQGSGSVRISPTDAVGNGSAVVQTVTAWSDTSSTFTASKGALSASTNYYLFVTNGTSQSNTSGYVVQFNPAKKLKVLLAADAAGAVVNGIVFGAPTGSDITGTKIGEFVGATFSETLELGEAVLELDVTEFGGSSLTTSDTPVVLVRNSTNTSGIVEATIIEE
jgi:hypothetical protein